MPTNRLLCSHALAACAMAAPWPGLLVAVWAATGSEALLGVVAGARMAPYVVCSSLAGVLADRMDRGRLVRTSVAGRVVLVAGCAVALTTDHPVAAACLATLAVAVGTPAYPASAAGLPRLAGSRADRATQLLVTIEVGAFVVGPAAGGFALTLFAPSQVAAGAAAVSLLALVLLRGIQLPAPPRPSVPSVPPATAGSRRAHGGVRRCAAVLRRSPRAAGAVVAVSAVNGMLGAVGVALLPLAHAHWADQPDAFGWATAALGVGALATPLLARLLHLPDRSGWLPLGLVGVLLAPVALVPSVALALPLVALVGATAVHVETVATLTVQRCVPDDARGSVLGLTDALMVASALAGAAATPAAASLLGPGTVVLALAVGLGLLVPAIWRLERSTQERRRVAASRGEHRRTVAHVEHVF